MIILPASQKQRTLFCFVGDNIFASTVVGCLEVKTDLKQERMGLRLSPLLCLYVNMSGPHSSVT